MKKPKTYKSATAFRTALEDRLKRISTEKGEDLQRLRKQVSFDRLLTRLFSKDDVPWVLKGGYAMELRIQSARATKDIDLAMRDEKLYSLEVGDRNLALQETIQECVSQPSVVDFFDFTIGAAQLDFDAPPEGGTRFPIEAKMDGRTFAKFRLDIGLGDVWTEPLEELVPRDWLGFAGIAPGTFPAISKEQQFAEKLHAYSLPRDGDRQNSRVKDLVDMLLLIDEGMDHDQVHTAIRATFECRGTHELPSELLPPPAEWEGPYGKLAEECGIEGTLSHAFETLKAYF